MKLEKLSTVVVEDEPPIRKSLIVRLNQSLDFEVVGQAGSVSEAVELIVASKPDVVFLDIKLTGGHGQDVLKRLKRMSIPLPYIVVCTAYASKELAIEMLHDFNGHVLYIIEKPFEFEWEEHKEKILDSIDEQESKNHPLTKLHVIPIKNGSNTFYLNPNDINYIKVVRTGSGKVVIYTTERKIDANLSLRQARKKLPPYFFQVSKYAAINLQKIDYINHSERDLYLQNGDRIGIGDSFYKPLMKQLPSK
ncbi:MAG: LytTR family DNA-binding domain-containing protein [Bacteroidota bacterium]